jgi:predicted DNA-binding transcriptional regulator YafY
VRRADRLFRLVQLLRHRRVTTAARLAEKLEVSERTIYRDIQDLALSGVPIQGEAGVGYALPRGFDLPPMMFTAEEIEALVLGARIVASWTDRSLAKAADGVLAKVEAVLPDRLKPNVDRTSLFAPKRQLPPQVLAHLAAARAAVSEQRKMRLTYLQPGSPPTERTVQPIGLFFWGSVWTMAAWCELRWDFRSFRLDRVQDAVVLEETFQPAPGRTREDFFRYVTANARKPATKAGAMEEI